MPEKLRFNRGRKYQGRNGNGNVNNNYGNQFVNNQFGAQPSSFLTLTNIADIAAIGGFNPTKYLPNPPPPAPVQTFSAPQQVFEQNKPVEKEEKPAKIDEAVTAEPAPAVVENE